MADRAAKGIDSRLLASKARDGERERMVLKGPVTRQRDKVSMEFIMEFPEI